MSLICAICIECLETRIAVSTTCGHILCSECATRQFTIRPTCPVCRREQTFEQLIRLFPEYGRSSESETSGDASSNSSTQQQIQIQIPKVPYPQPSQNPPLSPLSPTSSRITTQTVATRRIWLDVTGTRFPWTLAGPAPACGRDGSPVFLGLAAFKEGLHPCKICVEPQGRPVPYVPYGGEEHLHDGTTLLLPFDPTAMEWVLTSEGEIPEGRRPVEGGYERLGEEVLYHARAVVDGVTVLGKASEDGYMVRAALLGLGLKGRDADWDWTW